jgi:uncharacterized lipoprotein YajG
MRKIFFSALVVVLAACASSNKTAKVDIPQPEITVDQLSNTPAVAEHVTGGVPIYLGMSVTNRADIPITLKRVNIQSMGSGGYNVPAQSHPIDKVITPEGTDQEQFWVSSFATQSVAGVNGAVALRVIAQFDSPKGAFETVTVHQVTGRIP